MKRNKDFHPEEEVKQLLDSYKVDIPLEESQEQTIEILRGYLSLQVQPSPLHTLNKLFRKALKELFEKGKLQFSILMVLLLLFIPLLESNVNEYLLLFFTTPLPLFVGFWNLFGRSDLIMIELEKTFKYSYFQMLFSRVVVIIVTSIAFFTLLLIQFMIWGNNPGIHGLFSLIIWGLTPILLFSVALLMITTINRSGNIMFVSFLIWVFFGFASLSSSVGNFILHLNITFYISLNLLLIVVMVFQLNRLFHFTRKDSVRDEA
ncbi:hypothetical protein [Bacillus sp. JJ722]|uniref:hypothetical protein n=1 Tax=Bacillus sp. JJ722 TaxID=3122973 RepID=UPI002FFD87EE